MDSTAAVGNLAAELMEKLGDVEGRVRTVAIVAEVDTGAVSDFYWASSDDRTWVLEAFLARVSLAVGQASFVALMEPPEDEGDD